MPDALRRTDNERDGVATSERVVLCDTGVRVRLGRADRDADADGVTDAVAVAPTGDTQVRALKTTAAVTKRTAALVRLRMGRLVRAASTHDVRTNS